MTKDRAPMTKAVTQRLLVIGVWSLVILLSQGSSALASDADTDVPQLIERLGDPRYAERRDARRRLLGVGLSAFDELRAATTHPDPEVADTCALLLDELTSEWAWLDDPPCVRQRLEDYGRLAPAERVEAIRLLAILPGDEHVRPLARIAWFEPSDRLAHEAAAALLASPELDRPQRRDAAIADAVAELEAKHGRGRRPSARWLRLAASSGSGDLAPAERVDAWRRHALAERDRYERRPRETSLEVVANVYWEWLRAALRRGDDDAVNAAAVAVIELLPEETPGTSPLRVTRTLLWASEAQRPVVVDRLLAAYGDRLKDKRGLYVQARLALENGEQQRAEQLAEQALAADALTASIPSRLRDHGYGVGLAIAEELHSAGRADWARAEYAAIGAELDPLTEVAVVARWRLSESLHDAARYAEAAETLGELVQAINRTPTARRAYGRLDRVSKRFSRNAVVARQQLSAALAARDAGDRRAEIAALNKAITNLGDDADILIAMHQVKDPPPAFAKATLQRIEALCRSFEQQIAKAPGDAEYFNAWAWLVSNTEGDFDKAVRYSERSLQLRPGSAGLLDTLGRCYFSAGRVAEAVEVQRRAVELEPTMLVMRRQLAEFEAALAEPSEAP